MKENHGKVVGRVIKKYRKQKGLTQKQLGEKCNPPMFDSQIRSYESGRGNAKCSTIERIACGLGIEPMELMLDIFAELEEARGENGKE